MDSYFSHLIRSAELCGQILSKCRVKANLSRRELAEKIGFSETTIKAWENGDGSPSLSVMLTWFDVTGCNMFRSLLNFLWPDTFIALNAGSSISELRNALSLYISEIAGKLEIQRLYHMVFRGSSREWNELLELYCAYAHLTLIKRHHVVEINHAAYEICTANQTAIPCPFDDPRHVLVKAAISAAKTSILNNNSGYMVGFYDLPVTYVTAKILRESRIDSEVSQEQMAKAVNRSERTIQNWEKDIQPSFLEMCTWFRALDKNPWFYLRNALNPFEPVSLTEDTVPLRERLTKHFSTASHGELLMLAYLIFGEYGSYWNAVLEMMLEYVCLPPYMAALIARSIVTGYETDINTETLQCRNYILPELEHLERYADSLMEKAKDICCSGNSCVG